MRVFITHQIGRHHRGDQTCHQQAEQHGNGDGQAELAEILAGDARHERHRHEHRDDGESGGNHGEADFIGGFNRGTVGGFAHSDMSGDIFYLDYRVIDQNAGSECDGKETDQVQRKAQHVHHPERGHGRQGQGYCGDQGGAPVFQEGEHHKNGKDSAFNEGGKRCFIVTVGVENGVINRGDLYIRIFRADCRQRFIYNLGN